MPGPALRSCDCVGRQTTKPTLYLFFCWDSRHVWSPTLGTSTGPSPSSLDKRKRLFACPVAVGPGTAPARQCRARTVCKASRTTLSRCSPAQFLLLALYNTSLARRTKPNSELLQVLKTAAVALRIACTVGSGAVPGGSRRVSYSSSLPLPPPSPPADTRAPAPSCSCHHGRCSARLPGDWHGVCEPLLQLV